MTRTLYKCAFASILAWVFLQTLPADLFAQAGSYELPAGGFLTIQGDNFTFEQVISTVEGEEVVQERATWEGDVTATFTSDLGDIVLETEHIEAVFVGPDVSRLEAGPQVLFTGINGRATFECSDVQIDFPTSVAGQDIYSGICRDVHGYYLAYAQELGLEGDDQYEVNFIADAARLSGDEAVLEYPYLSLGNLEKPDMAIRSREIRLFIGLHPVSGDREVLEARLANMSVSIFGNRLNVLPFPIRRGFLGTHEPGWNIRLPRFGWEGDQGLRIDMDPAYSFQLKGFDDGPRLALRMDTFPFDRTYPEIIATAEKDGFVFTARAGYQREEDPSGDPVPTRAEPEIAVGIDRIPLGDAGFGIRGTTFWGHMRDMQSGLDLDRWGWQGILDHKGVDIGDLKLIGQVELNDFYYGQGDGYRTMEGRLRLRYVDPPHWGTSLTYRRVYEWGLPAFSFDVPQYVEEIGLREQSRFSRRWGAGFNWAWDFGQDEFRTQDCHLTYILDSFQVSLGWDFAGGTIRLQMGLPGSLQ